MKKFVTTALAVTAISVPTLGITEGLCVGIAALVVCGLRATYKFWRWHSFYGTRFLWGLMVASIGANIAGVPIAALAIRRIWLGPDAPSLAGTGEVLGLCILILLGTFVFLVLRWNDLDADMRRQRVGMDDKQRKVNLPPGHAGESVDMIEEEDQP